MPKEPSEVRVNSLTGWRKAIKRVASLEETALCEIDSLYDHLIPTPEQEEWIQEKIRLLKDESDAIADGTHSVRTPALPAAPPSANPCSE